MRDEGGNEFGLFDKLSGVHQEGICFEECEWYGYPGEKLASRTKRIVGYLVVDKLKRFVRKIFRMK